jgi:hypothetical protein
MVDDDRHGLVTMLGVAYTRTNAGRRAGAWKAGGASRDAAVAVPVAEAREQAFLEAHRPVWTWLLDHVDVSLIVDPDDPTIIWAWLLTSGDDVIHAVGCKRSFCERKSGEVPLSVELVADILGDRLSRHQVCTLELPQMRTRSSGSIGLDRPQEWSLDPTWLLTRMGVGR